MMEKVFIGLLIASMLSAIAGLIFLFAGFLTVTSILMKSMILSLIASVIIGAIGTYLANGE